MHLGALIARGRREETRGVSHADEVFEKEINGIVRLPSRSRDSRVPEIRADESGREPPIPTAEFFVSGNAQFPDFNQLVEGAHKAHSARVRRVRGMWIAIHDLQRQK